MSQQQPEVSSTISSAFAVKASDLANAISSNATDRFPAVLATSRLIAFMEIICARQLQPYLSAGQLSVGVRIDITHSAPTPEGVDVVVDSTFVGREGKLFVFEVTASDQAGEIGKARHTRAIVDVDRLENGAKKRAASTP